MKKTLLIAACILMCLCFSVDVSAQRNRTNPCGSDVNNLNLEILDSDPSSGNLFHVRSDGRGIYYPSRYEILQFQNGNCTYDFILNFNHGRAVRKAKMTIPDYPVLNNNTETSSTFNNFDRIASVPLTNTTNPAFNAFCGGDMNRPNVVQNPDGTYKYDNYAGCGFDSVTGKYYVRRNVGMPTTLSSGERVRFQNSPIDGGIHAGDTSYIRVHAYYVEGGYRAFDANGNLLPNTWELSPEPYVINGLSGTWAALLDGSANRIGERVMSFFMILRRPR